MLGLSPQKKLMKCNCYYGIYFFSTSEQNLKLKKINFFSINSLYKQGKYNTSYNTYKSKSVRNVIES